MAELEYKTIIVPTVARKYKGVKTTDERFARTIADAMNEAAAGGWRYERTEELAMQVRKGALRGRDFEPRTLMIFSREKPTRSPMAVSETPVARTEPTV